MISVKHKEHMPGGVQALIERMDALKKQQVLVGVPSEKNARKGDQKIGNAELVFIHTNGVRAVPMRKEMQPELNKGAKYSVALQMYLHAHGSAMMHAPARPIIEPSIKDKQDVVSDRLAQIGVAAMQGADVRGSLTSLGQFCASNAQKWFTNPKNGWAPNAPSTIKAKHSSKPLIDTGVLRQSITYIVEDEND